MSIQQSTELIIFVTHVEAEDSFLKIWGQIDKNSATCVERMILPLVEQFARSQGCVGPNAANLHINALCCARFQNEGYYRAKVINIRPDGMVVLQFIDYGNIEILPPQEIHLLQNIPGSESLQSFPPVAFEFTLMHVLPVNGRWDNKVIDSIKRTLWYSEFKILINTVFNNHRFIKLWYNNEDFGELLIKKNMAIGATLQDMFRPKCIQVQVPVYQQPSKHLVSNNCIATTTVQSINPLQCERNELHGFQRNTAMCCAAQQKHLMPNTVQEALVFKSRVLDVSSKHEVYVSFVEDGPQKFCVQLQSTSQILSMLMKDINSHPIVSLQEPPLPGSVCLGRYTQDKVLCRAVVMSVMENKCKLYYVDFGHTEVLPYTDIFQLPPHFINPRVLSIRFTLSGVTELNVTDEMKEYFKEIVSGKLLVLHVRPPEGPPLVQYGDLYDEEKNIKDILRQAFPTPAIVTPTSLSFTYQEPTKLSKGVEEIVHVSFVESCKKFFVQLDSGLRSLELIMHNLAEFSATAPTLNRAQIMIGLPCTALYDNQWCRAQILGMNADNIKVLFVDYGNEETMPLASIRVIHDDLVKKLQAQAIKCSLVGWELLPSTQEVYNKFESLILEERLHLRVIDTNLDGITVDLFEPETMESIKSKMLHIIGNEKRIINESLKCQPMETQHSTKVTSKTNQRSYMNLRLNLVQQRKNKINIEISRGNINEWRDKTQPDSWYQTQNDNSRKVFQEGNKFKLTRIDSKNEGNIHEYRKNKWDNKNECSDSVKNETGARGGSNRTSGNVRKGRSSHRSFEDSDTSSGESSRRRRGDANRSSYTKCDKYIGKTQNNKFSDRNSDGGFKTGRTNSDSNYGNNRVGGRKGQGYRLVQNRVNVYNSSTEQEAGRCSPMNNRREFHIPPPNINVGDTKTCEIVFTNSLSNFYVQLSHDYNALDSLMENIEAVYENGGDVMNESEILCGAYCVAQYSIDLKWYRAIIESVDENFATVHFVDYGNAEKVAFSKIKFIKKNFLELPIQAVNCKLFGVLDDNSDKSKIQKFEDIVTGKALEAEFIIEENGVYSVLIKEVVDGWPGSTFINEDFCNGIDLLKAKEDAICRRTATVKSKQIHESGYAPSDAKWSTISYAAETRKDVIVTWFINPNNFYCQIMDNESEFRKMMNEIQKIYLNKEPVSHTLQIGSPVIAVFSDDGVLYRAEVVELNKLNGHLIQYVDFGNSAVVESKKMYPVEKKLLQLPKQAIHCSLLNIIPQNGLTWSKVNANAIDNCFNADKYECIFHDVIDDKCIISLYNNGTDVANILVEKNLASFSVQAKLDDNVEGNTNKTAKISCDLERIDINLLSGQHLRVKVSNVENASEFYVQLPSAVECEDMITTYMVDKDPKVISLPGELAGMQNQAVECSLANVSPTPEIDVTLKESIEGKEIIIYVDKVENNRIIVKLFNLSGDNISISGDSNEKITPVCPMPILSSTHKVSVSYADHSASIWLQRSSDINLEKSLNEALNQYYSTSGITVKPKEDLLCVAQSADGNWYRAKIIKVKDTGVYVNFIDYGNNEEVTPELLRFLDTSFYTPHQLAINVSLPITLNTTVSEQLNILQNYLSNKELTAVFRNVNKMWIAELLYEGEKISDKFRSLNSTFEQNLSGTKKPQIHNVTVGYSYDVCVSHADSPSQFWLQHIDDAADLSKKQAELQDQAPSFDEINEILEEGSLCVAVYTVDNLWYRAQVLDADEDITTVRFIDYGNTDVIANKSDNIRHMPDSWKQIKEYATKCRLDIIPVESEDWNVATCEKFENLVNSVESLQAVIISNSVPKRIDLLINDKSISETLVEDHHALKVHMEAELIDEIVDLELDPHSAFVSHVNSPGEFWVQEEKSVSDLEVMADRFIVADMFPKVNEIRENLLCVAKYPDDASWYRARVVSHTDNATQVIYIDYGNSATSTEIREIPADLAEIPALSRKCRLDLPEGIIEWSEKACEEFIKLAADGATIFLLDIIKEDKTSVVKLTLDGKNVTDILAEFCERFPSISEERLPPLGEENIPNVFVSHINSPDDFWIQSENNTTDLNMILDRLHAAPSFLPLNTFEIGTICAAIFSKDGQWHRAKILSHTEECTEVLNIDYGNTSITNEVRMLPAADIINIPPLAKHCALQKPDTIHSWPVEACTAFKELAANGTTVFQLEIINDTGDPISVNLNLNGKNVVDILIPFEKNTSHDVLTQKEECEAGNHLSEGIDLNSESMKDITLETQRTRSEERNEDANQKMNENTDSSCVNVKYTLNLTVDEIVQNMKASGPEEDENTLESYSTETDENAFREGIELGRKIEAETSNEEHDIQLTEVDVQSNEDLVKVRNMVEEVLSIVTEKITLNTLPNLSDKSDLGSSEEQDNVTNSELPVCNSVTEKCEHSISKEILYCENLTEANSVHSEAGDEEYTETQVDLNSSSTKEEFDIPNTMNEEGETTTTDCKIQDNDKV